MLGPVLFGNRDALAATSRAAVRLSLGDTLKNEVSMSIRPRLRHLVPLPLPYSACVENRSATRLRSVSVARISSGRILSRSWISASFKASLAARVTSA